MATSLAVQISAAVNWALTSDLDLSDPIDKATLSYTDAITNGTEVDTATKVWHDRGTIASGGTAAIDLAGSLTDAFGNALVFTKVKGILLINRGIASGTTFTETSGENILVTTSTLVAFASNGMVLEPAGCLLLTSPKVGQAVTATSADVITLSRAGSGTVTYDIVIWGLI
jgi:hypothetical protein